MERSGACSILALVFAAVVSCSTAFSPDSFRAAVYEHARRGNFRSDTAEFIMQSNLQYYERAAAAAKAEGADIILFPEYGIFPPLERDVVKLETFLELIPDPKEVRTLPCVETEDYSTRPILRTLSCIALNNHMIVVANMGAREPCNGEADCPEDGEFHHSANVAFDEHGALISRYYKEHLFYEFGYDLPRQVQDPIFETSIAKFAMFVSFDIRFKRMAVDSRLPYVDATLFSSLDMNLSPFFTSIQLWQAWAMGNNATLLAANNQIPGFYNSGSGIFRGLKGSIVSVFNPDGISKLMVATVPKRNGVVPANAKIFAIKENEVTPLDDNRDDLPEVCSAQILGDTDKFAGYRCRDEITANYTLEKLTGAEGHVEVCNNGMCCELDYSADSMGESFYLGVFNGTRNFFERYFFAEEDCFLARCEDLNGTACATFPMYSNTVFRRVSLKTKFSTNYIYPSLMSNRMRLVPVQDWTFEPKTGEASIEFNSNSGIKLLQATLMGRVYDKDPPYVR